MEELDQDLIQILEARKLRLQELKEEMNDVLFEEFILKQGDFMNIEIARKGICFGNILNKKTGGYFLTTEEKDLLSKQTSIDIEFYNKKYEEELEYKKLEKKMIEDNEILKQFGKEVEEEVIDTVNYALNLYTFKHNTYPEFESRFWKYISDNGGFKNGCCPKCGNTPKITRVLTYLNEKQEPINWYSNRLLEYREIFERIPYKTSVSGKILIKSGVIKSIYCCKFLYDFEEKKMYKIGYPGKLFHSKSQYIPCETYDFKTKKDLYEEMQTMKASFEARLSKLESLLNL